MLFYIPCFTLDYILSFQNSRETIHSQTDDCCTHEAGSIAVVRQVVWIAINLTKDNPDDTLDMGLPLGFFCAGKNYCLQNVALPQETGDCWLSGSTDVALRRQLGQYPYDLDTCGSEYTPILIFNVCTTLEFSGKKGTGSFMYGFN